MDRLAQRVFDGGMTHSSINHRASDGSTAGHAPLPDDVDPRPVLLVGGAGMTGSRVARRMGALGIPLRTASRSATIPFDWEDSRTWPRALERARAAHLAFQPDLAVPWAADVVGRVAELAATLGVERLTLVSGRGEDGAERAEQAVLAAHPYVVVARCSWFAQNFSEGVLAGAVAEGTIALPVPADVPEPFVDLEDVADVLALGLTGELPAGTVHELTGPQSLTMEDVAAALSEASGRDVRFTSVSPTEFVERSVAAGLDRPTADFLAQLFTELLDGRNVTPTTTLQRLLGRPAGTFAGVAGRSLGTIAAPAEPGRAMS